MIKCEWCDFTTDYQNGFSNHLKRIEKNKFISLEALERYRIKRLFSVSDAFIDELIERYKNGISKHLILKQTNIDITILLDLLNVKRTMSEAHNTIEYKNKFKKVIFDKYGVDNISKLQDVKDKKKKTVFDHYGVISGFLTQHALKEKDIALNQYYNDKERMSNTWKKTVQKINEKYGENVANISQLSFVKKKISQFHKLINSKKTILEKQEMTKKCREVWNKQYWLLPDNEKRKLFLKRMIVTNYESSLEIRIHKSLDELHLKYVKHVFVNSFNYDIELNKKILIEVQGDYWHCNPTIYSENDIVHSGFTAGELWKKDENKKNNAIKYKRHYYSIWESELQEMTDDDIKNWLLLIIKEVIDKENNDRQNS